MPEHTEHAGSVEDQLRGEIRALTDRVKALEAWVAACDLGSAGRQTKRDSTARLAVIAEQDARDIHAGQETQAAASKATDVRVAALELAAEKSK